MLLEILLAVVNPPFMCQVSSTGQGGFSGSVALEGLREWTLAGFL